MSRSKNLFLDKVKSYHFQLKHLTILVVLLVFFQVLISFIYKQSIQNFLLKTQKWYQQDFAERIANLTATSLELLLENAVQEENLSELEVKKITQSFNIILTQQLLQHHVEDVCVILYDENGVRATDDGRMLFNYFFEQKIPDPHPDATHAEAVKIFRRIVNRIENEEKIYSMLEEEHSIHVFVPFVPKGEFAGVVYIKHVPDFAILTSGIIQSYNETSLIYIVLIIFGLLAMYYISSYTLQERNEATALLYQEREKKLKENIHLEKEAMFAKRIYHTHHKAEKVMGFIKEDLRLLSPENIQSIKYRVVKYANFVSRVIYDMKWYDPPLLTVRSPIFRTNLNELIRFIVDNIFNRVAKIQSQYSFDLDLDDKIPPIKVNEFVVWEVLEPLIQNSIEHTEKDQVEIKISTLFDKDKNEIRVKISDNGSGIRPELLELNHQGIKKIFLEHVTTKKEAQRNSGFGCYIAHQIATQRCGWKLDARNLPENGCEFELIISL